MRSVMIGLMLLTSAVSSGAWASIDRFVQVAPGIYRGDQPDSDKDYQKLKGLGVKTILNLRSDGTVDDEADVARQMGFGFKRAPIKSTSYPKESTVDYALSVLTDRALQPVFIHCQKGKDRTGMVIGLYRVHFEGWTQDQAYKEMKSLGFSSSLVGLRQYFFDHSQ